MAARKRKTTKRKSRVGRDAKGRFKKGFKQSGKRRVKK